MDVSQGKIQQLDLKEGMALCAGLNWLLYVLKARSFERIIF
jgi:hypothetical protein